MMEEALTAYILGSVALAAIVGGRIDWAVRPQASLTPSIVLQNITTVPYYSDEGDTGLSTTRIQADCWAKTYALAKSAARELTNRLSGGQAKFIQSGIEFQTAFKEDEQDSFERGAAAEDLYRVRLDFTLIYRGV